MVELDEVIQIGAITVGAIVERSVRSNSLCTVSIYGEKYPVAVLVRRADSTTMAFEVDGPQIKLDDLEKRFPCQRAEFERIGSNTAARPATRIGPD